MTYNTSLAILIEAVKSATKKIYCQTKCCQSHVSVFWLLQTHVIQSKTLFYTSVITKDTLLHVKLVKVPGLLPTWGFICTQFHYGLGVKIYHVHIERPHEQLLYFCHSRLWHVGYHSLNIKVVHEGALYTQITFLLLPKI